MYKCKISSIKLNDGTSIVPGGLMVLVGPNNTGKSRFLKDIVKIVAQKGASRLVVRDVDVELPESLEDLLKAYPQVRRKTGSAGSPQSRAVWLGADLCSAGGHACQHKWPADFQAMLRDANQVQKRSRFYQHFGSGLIAHLTTEHRLQLVNRIQTNAVGQKKHLCQALYDSDPETETRIRAIVRAAFDNEVALDFSEPGSMLFRVRKNFDSLPADPRKARGELSLCEAVDVQGDGFRSFVGMAVALESVTRDVVLVDEPEAFLHPPQAYRAGELLGQHAKNGKQLIVATHSSEVVKGILSTFPTSKILRIDRQGRRNSFSMLDTDVVTELIRDPLLSSIRVIDGLFYTAAVVVEADADARFYQSVAAKLLGRDEVYFVNADNKQTVPRVLAAYRRANVPSAGVVDFDALNSAQVLRDLLVAAGIPESEIGEMQEIRLEIGRSAGEKSAVDRLRDTQTSLESVVGEVVAAIHRLEHGSDADIAESEKKLSYVRNRIGEAGEYTRPWRDLKKRGRSALSPELQSKFDLLYDKLKSHGMFINPAGELESMLGDQGIEVTNDKRGWILRALQLLRSLQIELDKMPWKFIQDVLAYVRATTAPAPGAESSSTPEIDDAMTQGDSAQCVV